MRIATVRALFIIWPIPDNKIPFLLQSGKKDMRRKITGTYYNEQDFQAHHHPMKQDSVVLR